MTRAVSRAHARFRRVSLSLRSRRARDGVVKNIQNRSKPVFSLDDVDARDDVVPRVDAPVRRRRRRLAHVASQRRGGRERTVRGARFRETEERTRTTARVGDGGGDLALGGDDEARRAARAGPRE
jgi:hypothetical protein